MSERDNKSNLLTGDRSDTAERRLYASCKQASLALEKARRSDSPDSDLVVREVEKALRHLGNAKTILDGRGGPR